MHDLIISSSHQAFRTVVVAAFAATAAVADALAVSIPAPTYAPYYFIFS